MIFRTVLAMVLLPLATAAYSDTENVRKGQAQLKFRPVASASGGATASRPPASGAAEDVFRFLDIDGDGFVSKAEAAGHEKVTLGFDRADRNRDGKLSFAEYDSIGKPQPAAKKKTATAKGPGSASAGATKKEAKTPPEAQTRQQAQSRRPREGGDPVKAF